MDGSPRHISTFVPADEQSRFFPKELHDRQGKIHLLCEPYVNRAKQAAGVYTSAKSRLLSRISPKSLLEPTKARILTLSKDLYPLVFSYCRRFFPFLPLSEPAAEPAEPHPVQLIMEDFQGLGREQQERVARNLALLWQNFLDAFGGISGFRSASPTEQQAYIEKLEVAARRMASAKGSEATFHYVTVELMRQYVSFFHAGSTDPYAVVLARLVAPLIDRGRILAARTGTEP